MKPASSMKPVSSAVGSIVYTSVDDGLGSARYSAVGTIKKAIAFERAKKRGSRVALIAGLERELRRRAKGGRPE